MVRAIQELRTKLINAHLKKIKKSVCANKWTFEDYRSKNKDFMQRNGLIIDDIKDTLLDLNSSHYFKGPEPDRDSFRKGDVWFFVYPLKMLNSSLNIYIKIRLDGDNVVCISFHEEGQYLG